MKNKENIDLLGLLKGISNINKSDNSPMEIALSKTLLLLTEGILKRTILPKRAIKNLALLNNDIFFNEVIIDYKENLKDQKKIISIYSNLIKYVSKGIGNESERKGIMSYLKGKINRGM